MGCVDLRNTVCMYQDTTCQAMELADGSEFMTFRTGLIAQIMSLGRHPSGFVGVSHCQGRHPSGIVGVSQNADAYSVCANIGTQLILCLVLLGALFSAFCVGEFLRIGFTRTLKDKFAKMCSMCPRPIINVILSGTLKSFSYYYKLRSALKLLLLASIIILLAIILNTLLFIFNISVLINPVVIRLFILLLTQGPKTLGAITITARDGKSRLRLYNSKTKYWYESSLMCAKKEEVYTEGRILLEGECIKIDSIVTSKVNMPECKFILKTNSFRPHLRNFFEQLQENNEMLIYVNVSGIGLAILNPQLRDIQHATGGKRAPRSSMPFDEMDEGYAHDHITVVPEYWLNNENITLAQPSMADGPAFDTSAETKVSEVTTIGRVPELGNMMFLPHQTFVTSQSEDYKRRYSFNMVPLDLINRDKVKAMSVHYFKGLAHAPGVVDYGQKFFRKNEMQHDNSTGSMDFKTSQWLYAGNVETFVWNLARDGRHSQGITMRQELHFVANTVNLDHTTLRALMNNLSINRNINDRTDVDTMDDSHSTARAHNIKALAALAQTQCYKRMFLCAWLQLFQHYIAENDVGIGTTDQYNATSWGEDTSDIKWRYAATYKAGRNAPRPAIYGCYARSFGTTVTRVNQNNVVTPTYVWGNGFANQGKPLGEAELWDSILAGEFDNGDAALIDCKDLSGKELLFYIYMLGNSQFRLRLYKTVHDATTHKHTDYRVLRNMISANQFIPGAKKIFLHFGHRPLTLGANTVPINGVNVPAFTIGNCLGLDENLNLNVNEPAFTLNAGWIRHWIYKMMNRLGCVNDVYDAYELATNYFCGYVVGSYGKGMEPAIQEQEVDMKLKEIKGDVVVGSYLAYDDSQKEDLMSASMFGGNPTVPQDYTLHEYFRLLAAPVPVDGPMTKIMAIDMDTLMMFTLYFNHMLSWSRQVAAQCLSMNKRTWADLYADRMTDVAIHGKKIVQRGPASRQMSYYDAVTANVCAMSFGFSPGVITLTHDDYTRTKRENNDYCFTKSWQDWMIPMYQMPYAFWPIHRVMPESYILPTRSTAPKWNEQLMRNVKNSIARRNQIRFAPTLNPIAETMWLNDGGEMWCAQHYGMANPDGSENTSESYPVLYRKVHPYIDEMNDVWLQSKYQRVRWIHLGKHELILPGSVNTFSVQDKNTQTFGFKSDVPRDDWTRMALHNVYDIGYCSATYSYRGPIGSIAVEADALAYAVISLRDKVSHNVVGHQLVRVDTNVYSAIRSADRGLLTGPASIGNEPSQAAVYRGLNRTVRTNGLKLLDPRTSSKAKAHEFRRLFNVKESNNKSNHVTQNALGVKHKAVMNLKTANRMCTETIGSGNNPALLIKDNAPPGMQQVRFISSHQDNNHARSNTAPTQVVNAMTKERELLDQKRRAIAEMSSEINTAGLQSNGVKQSMLKINKIENEIKSLKGDRNTSDSDAMKFQAATKALEQLGKKHALNLTVKRNDTNEILVNTGKSATDKKELKKIRKEINTTRLANEKAKKILKDEVDNAGKAISPIKVAQSEMDKNIEATAAQINQNNLPGMFEADETRETPTEHIPTHDQGENSVKDLQITPAENDFGIHNDGEPNNQQLVYNVDTVGKNILQPMGRLVN